MEPTEKRSGTDLDFPQLNAYAFFGGPLHGQIIDMIIAPIIYVEARFVGIPKATFFKGVAIARVAYRKVDDEYYFLG